MVLFGSWVFFAATCVGFVKAHTEITYPGWRGYNLGINSTFPFGMQWSYPCGGLNPTTNRTKWPVNGGAIAIQPGWYGGHKTALFYINLGLGTDGPYGGPPNMSFPMVGPFEIIGPTDNSYPGTFCLPQVPLPENITVNVGDLATIQVVESAVHGGALYNCVDIVFALPEDVAEINATNCFNSSTISFSDPFVEATCTTSSASPSDTSSYSFGRSTCSPCSVSTTTVVQTCTATPCPKTNGNSGSGTGTMDGLGWGAPLGVLVLGVLGL